MYIFKQLIQSIYHFVKKHTYYSIDVIGFAEDWQPFSTDTSDVIRTQIEGLTIL